MLEIEEDYAILYNTWEEHTSKIKVPEDSLEVIETTMDKAVAYYMQCVLGDKRVEIWKIINEKMAREFGVRRKK